MLSLPLAWLLKPLYGDLNPGKAFVEGAVGSRKGDGGNGDSGAWKQSLACGPVGRRPFGILWTCQVRLAASGDPVIVQVTPPHLPKAWGPEGDAATRHCGT